MKVIIIILLLIFVPYNTFAKKDAEDIRLDALYKQCVDACPKPIKIQGPDDKVWVKNQIEELKYETCISRCDAKQLRGKF